VEPVSKNRSLLVSRLLSLAVTAGALWFVFRKLDFASLEKTFLQMQPGWFLGAIFFFGLAFPLGAWRWHLMLRLTRSAVHGGASLRVLMVGHFFYTVFFGAAGSDVARCGLYHRWFGMPLPQVLSSVTLDRLLGLSGLMLFAAVAFGLAQISSAGATVPFERMTIRGFWLFALLLVVLPLGVWRRLKKPRSDTFISNTLHTFAESFRDLVLAPRTAASGVVLGFLVQSALIAVLALNVRAVCHTPLPWNKLLWVFPLIFFFSALPISINGLGLRETASLTLLGLYGVPASDAVAASLLTFVTGVVWMGVGGILLLHEENSFRKTSQRRPPETFSAVIPTFNEAEALPETVRHAQALPEITEIIVVDGGSTDGTAHIAQQLGCRVLASAPGRGGQMRLGASVATGDVIILLHADTWLPADAGRAAINCLRDTTVVAGGFWKVFRHPNILMRGSKWKCAVRLFVGHRIAGDQALFVRRPMLEQVGGVPDIPLMEEFELCTRLRKIGRLALADAVVKTSARRFFRHGVVRTYLRMWRVTLQYYLGASPRQLHSIYEKK
jgi:rSAM/selenodomain-associated transferase 2